MTRLRRAPWAPERLDLTGHAPPALAESLRDVTHANDWFGGTRSLRRGLAPFLEAGGSLSVLDAGTGSADVLLGLVRWARRRGVSMRPVGLDAHAEVLDIARRRAPGMALVRGDLRALPFRSRSVDIVVATLVLHHLPDDAQVAALKELARVARRGVIVAELERHRIHWLGAKLLAMTVWRRSPITSHDAPVSVRRGYTREELAALARDAGLDGRVRRFLFYRLLLTAAVGQAREDASRTV